MGVSLELNQLVLPPDTPPALVSPGASSYTSLSSSYDQLAWAPRPDVNLPMSNHEHANGSTKMYSEKSGVQMAPGTSPGAASRQQLPSLSSLFGLPSSSRPAPSPSHDHPAGYPVTSPWDRPTWSSHSNNPQSYFPPAYSPPQQQHRHEYHPRTPLDRPAHHHHLSQSLSGSLRSPSSRAPHAPYSATQHEGDYRAHWATPGPGHQERQHSHMAHPAPFRSPPEHFQLTFPGARKNEIGTLEYEKSHHQAHTPNVQPGYADVDGVTVKDGLGPKIWTGTHFLPRFVRSAEVQGEGVCYFYDDGSHCKAIIDGEAVNAHWGVTKAGKPRKRLAIACLTCRERKIKCDPDFPKCIQCDKFGRICKFKNAPRGGQNTSPTTSSTDLTELRGDGGTRATQDTSNHSRRSDASSPRTPEASPPSDSPDGSKRLKVSQDRYVPLNASVRPLEDPEHDKVRKAAEPSTVAIMQIPDEVLSRASHSNPYTDEPRLIDSVVSHFFARFQSTSLVRFMTEHTFKSWFNRVAKHNDEDLMLLYSVLAVGMVMQGHSSSNAFEYAQVALYAQKKIVEPCIQLVQSRLLLALYYKLTKKTWELNEMLCAAASTATFLEMNREAPSWVHDTASDIPFGLNRHGYTEMCRRTLWCLFLLERMDGDYPRKAASLNVKDICIRLPADAWTFERQLESKAPIFEPSRSQLNEHDLQFTSPAAYHHRLSPGKMQVLQQKLQEWHNNLPRVLDLDLANFKAATSNNSEEILATMHMLYNHAMVVVQRAEDAIIRSTRSDPLDSEHHRRRRYICQISRVIESSEATARQQYPSARNPPIVWMTILRDCFGSPGDKEPQINLSQAIDETSQVLASCDKFGNAWPSWGLAKAKIEQRLQRLIETRDRNYVPRKS